MKSNIDIDLLYPKKTDSKKQIKIGIFKTSLIVAGLIANFLFGYGISLTNSFPALDKYYQEVGIERETITETNVNEICYIPNFNPLDWTEILYNLSTSDSWNLLSVNLTTFEIGVVNTSNANVSLVSLLPDNLFNFGFMVTELNNLVLNSQGTCYVDLQQQIVIYEIRNSASNYFFDINEGYLAGFWNGNENFEMYSSGFVIVRGVSK